MKNYQCPLCESRKYYQCHADTNRKYYRCEKCSLIFVPKEYHLSEKAERDEYNLHQNDPNDLDYRNFLNRLFIPINKLLKSNSYGLDFGSGPGPTLSIMFYEAGHHMDIYDKFYAKAPELQTPSFVEGSLIEGPLVAFNKRYDFITATEVFEHLENPKGEIKRLWDCLKNSGYLAIMTKLVIDDEKFKTWHYKNDMTHISYFSKETFQWLAKQLGGKINFIDNDVITFQKKASLPELVG